MHGIEKWREATMAAVRSPAAQRALFMASATGAIGSGILGCLALTNSREGFLRGSSYSTAQVFVPLTFILGWYAFHLGRELARAGRLWGNRGELYFSPYQLQLLNYASFEVRAKRFDMAEEALAKILGGIWDNKSREYHVILQQIVVLQLEQEKIGAVELACDEYLQSEAASALKAALVDTVASSILFRLESPWLGKAERLIRRAIELAPDAITLKGTLGSLLVEQGNLDAAEPLLRDCLEHSAAEPDRAISLFYLGLIQCGRGKATEGNAMMTEAMEKYPEEWMRKKARGK